MPGCVSRLTARRPHRFLQKRLPAFVSTLRGFEIEAALSFPRNQTVRVLDLCRGLGDGGCVIRHEYAHQQIPDDTGGHRILAGVFGMGPQIGYIFPVGDMQGYLNLKAYGEFDQANRPAG
jgi:hypothetical protein